MDPMKLEVYNAIVDDFNKSPAFNRKSENELRKKYEHIPSSSFGSIISSLVQRAMKQNYRKSAQISSKYYETYQRLLKENKVGTAILKLAEIQSICPALCVRSILENVYQDPVMLKKCFKDTSFIKDKDLAAEVFIATLNDNHYGPHVDVVKQSIGLEYEIRLERELTLNKIQFEDEGILRFGGYDKTPDFKLTVPIAVDGFIVNWIESKALFGDEENHGGYLKDQLSCYCNRFGPGLVIYWFGFLETLNKSPHVSEKFILRSGFPPKESLTTLSLHL